MISIYTEANFKWDLMRRYDQLAPRYRFSLLYKEPSSVRNEKLFQEELQQAFENQKTTSGHQYDQLTEEEIKAFKGAWNEAIGLFYPVSLDKVPQASNKEEQPVSLGRTALNIALLVGGAALVVALFAGIGFAVGPLALIAFTAVSTVGAIAFSGILLYQTYKDYKQSHKVSPEIERANSSESQPIAPKSIVKEENSVPHKPTVTPAHDNAKHKAQEAQIQSSAPGSESPAAAPGSANATAQKPGRRPSAG